MTFAALGLPPHLLRAVAAQGYTTPTPVQRAAIPLVAAGRDVIAEAQTGSGKTAAFALPLLQQLGPPGPVQVLVLAPTRELAVQVAGSFQALDPSRAVLSLIGGAPIEPQLDALADGVDVVVATPGRLLDHIARSSLVLDTLQALVLDEADRLLDEGFQASLNTLLAALPPKRQTLLFSATLPPAVRALCARLLRDPATVSIAAAPETAPDITQRAYQVDRDRRRLLLQHLLATEGWSQTLVFVATRRASENLAQKLRRAGLSAVALHGQMEQHDRSAALERFSRGRAAVLVATDLAARGLDIPRLDAVVNFDLPRSPAGYTHRIGRTGRAGASGVAVSFVDHDTEAHLRLIEKKTSSLIPRHSEPGFPLTGEPRARRKGPAPVKGKRKSKKDKLREAAARAAAAARED